MSDEQTIEVQETQAPAVAVEKPTRDEVIKERGWSAEEADKAEKFGMLKAPEEKKEEPKVEAKVEPVAPQVKQVERTEEDRRKTIGSGLELTAEQEAEIEKIAPRGVKGLLGQIKYERSLKQRWRQETEALKARVAELEKPKTTETPKVEVDEAGNEIDLDDKPLTRRELREIEEKRREEWERQQKEASTKAQITSEAQKAHEELARASYEDFDEAVKLAGDLMKNIDEHYPSGKMRSRINALMTEFADKAKRSHEIDEDEFNEADLAYEIGKLHPNYGKSSASNGSKAEEEDGSQPEISPNKVNGGHTPEKLKRIEQNTQRRVSSAAIPASGKKTVSASEVTLDHLSRMTRAQLESYKQKYPERYQTLLRG